LEGRTLKRLLLLAFILLCSASRVNAAYSFIQYKSSGFIASTSGSTPSFTIAASHLLVVKCSNFNVVSNTRCSTITDSAGDTFTEAVASLTFSSNISGGESAEFWYNSNTIGMTGTVSGTVPGGGGGFVLEILDYSGIQVGSTSDAVNGGIVGNGSPESINITTSYVDDLVIVGVINNAGGGWVWTAPFTERDGGSTLSLADRDATPAGTYTATGTGGSDFWAMSIIAFKVAPAASGSQIGIFLVGP
jgi:hypothetical protein